jgi:hypothetical protein
MFRNTFDYVISLGPACRTGFQIRRQFSSKYCVPSVFDRQVTPAPVIVDYFRRDFRGFFERADLVQGEVYSDVRNTRFGTTHPHDISVALDEGYAKARDRHDRLCGNIRNALNSSHRVLFVAQDNGYFAFEQDIRGAIAAANPRLRFELVLVQDTGPATRPPPNAWKGDDAPWEEKLQAYKIAWRGAMLISRQRLMRHLEAKRF